MIAVSMVRDTASRRFAACGAKLAVFFALFVLAMNAPSMAGELRVSAYKVSGTDQQTRVDIVFDRDPALNWFLLKGPYRLVIDLPASKFLFEPEALKPRGIVAGVRYGEMAQGKARLILTARKPFKIASIDVAPVAGKKDVFALAIELGAASRAEFDAALKDQASQTASVASAGAGTTGAVESKFTIVLDPGHGGVDGGAESDAGTIEKTITLAFAQELKKKLEQTGRYNVLLTRESDMFVPLGARVAFARQHEAKLFISIHADTIRVKGLRGATVYTVSDNASDEESAALADRENLADQTGGVAIQQDNEEVADILVDLLKRETHGFSVAFAKGLVGELSRTVKLINNPHRHARFRVLRAPDVPSVLVELGYLSNPDDEQQLQDAAWREKTADSIVQAVNAFSAASIQAGG